MASPMKKLASKFSLGSTENEASKVVKPSKASSSSGFDQPDLNSHKPSDSGNKDVSADKENQSNGVVPSDGDLSNDQKSIGDTQVDI